MSGRIGPKGPPGPRGLPGPSGISSTSSITALYGGTGISIGSSGQNGYIISTTVVNSVVKTPSDFTSPPNPPTNLLVDNVTSTSLDLTWTYPTQSPYAFGLAPSINTFFYQLFSSGDVNILDASSTVFINPTDTTLHISSSNTDPAGIIGNVLNVPNMSDITNIIIGYGNLIGNTFAPEISALYESALAPAAPTNLALTNVNAPYDTYTNSLSWMTPLAEAGITTSLAIFSYNISYNSIGSTIRFQGTPITDNNSIVVLAGIAAGIAGSTNNDSLNIMPDATYNFQIKATNNASPLHLDSSLTLPYSTTTATLSPKLLSFPSTVFLTGVVNFFITTNSSKIFQVSSPNSQSTNLIKSFGNNSAAATIHTNNITWPIQTVSTRGNNYQNSNQLTIKNTVTTISAPSTPVSSNNIISSPLLGFSAIGQPIMTLSSGGIFINGKYEDSYSSNANTSYQGFYTNLSINSIDISTNFFTPSPNNQSLDISDTNGSGNNHNILTYSYDGSYNNSPPTGIIISATNLSTPILITGISIYDQIDLSVNTTVSNIGTFFYVSPVLNYSLACTNGITNTVTNISKLENFLNNLESIANFTGGGGLKPTVTFKNPDIPFITGATVNIYSTTTILNITAVNALGTSNISSFTIPNVIIDQPSFSVATALNINVDTQSIINNVLAQSVAFRAVSGIYGINLTSETINNFSYNNNKSIIITDGSYNSELPIINGLFCFPTAANLPAAYNGLILTNTENMRYATFVWKISPAAVSTTQNTLNFLFNNANNQVFQVISSNNIIVAHNTSTNQNTQLSLDFNIVVSNDNYITNANDTLTFNWINGAVTSNIINGITTNFQALTKGNFNSASTTLFCAPNTPLSTSSCAVSYGIPGIFINSPGKGYVLLRVGLPLGSLFTFSSVSASLTTS